MIKVLFFDFIWIEVDCIDYYFVFSYLYGYCLIFVGVVMIGLVNLKIIFVRIFFFFENIFC